MSAFHIVVVTATSDTADNIRPHLLDGREGSRSHNWCLCVFAKYKWILSDNRVFRLVMGLQG